eukprot:gene17405-22954_t
MSQDEEYLTLSIASIGPATLPNVSTKVHALHKTNDISDIEGSKYESKYEKYTNKPAYNPLDVPGSQPRQLIKPRNGPNYSLYIDDIEGSRYAIRDKMLLSKRHIDPLVPEYKLPSYIPAIPYEQKFIRDNIDVSDVDGTKSKPLYYRKTRDSYKVDDIDGTKADYKNHYQKKRLEAPPADIMKVDDITSDIAGATSGWKETSDVFNSTKRRDIRNINYIADIEGAQADTLKRSLVTKRNTNPLYPDYQSLDDGQLLPQLIKPLIPSNLITNPTWRPPRPTEKTISELKKSSTTSSLNASTKLVPFDWSSNHQDTNRSNYSTNSNELTNLMKSASGNLSYRSNKDSNNSRKNSRQSNQSKKSLQLQADIETVRLLQ